MEVSICAGDLIFSNEGLLSNELNLGSFWFLTNIMEKVMNVGGLGDSWDLNELLLDVDDGGKSFNDEWDFLLDKVLFKFVEGLFFNDGDFVWGKDLSGVALEELGYVWLLNGDLVWDLLPLGLLEGALDVVWLLLVLSDSNLAGDDVWNLLHDGVVDSLGGFVWDGDIFLNWYFVVDSVWDLG